MTELAPATDELQLLDDPDEQPTFTRTVREGGRELSESVLVVQGMHCAACADTVETTLEHQAGVTVAQVQAVTRRLTLRWDPSLTRLSDLARAVRAAGYRLLPLAEALSLNQRRTETRRALWRLFVAGFCMMQVMMYAWPSYVAAPGDIPADIDQLLRWASWVISLPVVFFASGPFFRSAWTDLKRGRVGMDTPVSLGILVTFIVSSAATFDPTGPWGAEVWFDSLTMFVFFLLGGRYLELKARDRTAGALDELMSRLPEQCERRTASGGWETVTLRRLKVGDVVRVQAGQAFPGDGDLLSESASVDEALLTGESEPLSRRRGEAVVAGSHNLAGVAELRITRLGGDTRFAQIVQLMERAATEKPRLAQLADRIAAPFLVLVVLAAAAALLWWWPRDSHQALAVAVAVLIVTCPCALSLATPAAMLASAGALARRGVLVRRLQAFEALARVDTVVFDKTGTLTQDRLHLQTVFTRSGVSREQALQLAAVLGGASRHPLSRALVAEGAEAPAGAVLQEAAGQGVTAEWPDGRRFRLGSARFLGLADDAWPAGGPAPEAPVAHLADERGWLASFVFEEALRPDARLTIARLQALGLRTHLLSGDRLPAARRVALATGVDSLRAQATPEDKLAEVLALQAEGRHVAMVGDGLNDGPVLARADTSFALGHAVPLAQARSDFVVQGNRLADVADTLLLARATLRTVRQNLAWAAAYNAVCVPLALVGWMPPWLAGLGMAASSLFVIGNALRLARRSTPEAPAALQKDASWTFSTS